MKIDELIKYKSIYKIIISFIINYLRFAISIYRCSLYLISNHFKKIESISNVNENIKGVIIYTVTLTLPDGIGNDVINQAKVLESAGIKVQIAAKYCSDRKIFNAITHTEAISYLKTGQWLLLCHYGIYSDGIEELFLAAGKKSILRYQNITPAKYFKYSQSLAHNCRMGILQVKYLIGKKIPNIYMASSQFSKNDLIKMGVKHENVIVIPPFVPERPININSKNVDIEKSLKNIGISMLFVGRLVPNKGYEHLLKILSVYINKYGKNVTLHLVGKSYDSQINYYRKISKMAKKMRVYDNIIVWDELEQSDLEYLYKNIDIFICASEHEGFGIPILEAQGRKIPVVVFDTSAVGETAGRGFCTIEAFDYSKMVEKINLVCKSNTEKKLFIEYGIKNYNRFNYELVGELLKNNITNIIKMSQNNV